jgi:hypothetical protein
MVNLPDLELGKVKFVVNSVNNRIKSYKEFKNVDLLINDRIVIDRKSSKNKD